MSDKNVEPSLVLWIGFPALLKVDEIILRKAFSPFGEIEKITAFPGRSYAFVRFSSILSACRAKETLQGKLFGNPRVHICFAKSETGSNSGKSSTDAPRLKSNVRLESSGNLRQDRNFGSLTGDLGIRSPQTIPDLDGGDFDAHHLNRKHPMWTGGSDTFKTRRFSDLGSDLGLAQGIYENHDSPTIERCAQLHDYSQAFPQASPSYEDPWDFSEDIQSFHGAKKLKTGSFLPEKDLPEHPFSDFKQGKRMFPKVFSNLPQSDSFSKNFVAVPSGYKQNPDIMIYPAVHHEERSDQWEESYDSLQVGSGSLLYNHIEKKRFTPESEESSLNEWKWEGTIAKGGTPVCRARCFPVGKILDIML